MINGRRGREAKAVIDVKNGTCEEHRGQKVIRNGESQLAPEPGRRAGSSFQATRIVRPDDNAPARPAPPIPPLPPLPPPQQPALLPFMQSGAQLSPTEKQAVTEKEDEDAPPDSSDLPDEIGEITTSNHDELIRRGVECASRLTGRPFQVFKHCGLGKSNSEIATELGISEGYVGVFLVKIFAALGLGKENRKKKRGILIEIWKAFVLQHPDKIGSSVQPEDDSSTDPQGKKNPYDLFTALEVRLAKVEESVAAIHATLQNLRQQENT